MYSKPATEKYFSLVPERDCGECMVCCKHLSISSPNFHKPADVLCDNCIVNQGCQIYETRPNVCRTWHCLWRRVESMPDELRPDKSGIIFALTINYDPMELFENAYIACMTLEDRSVFKKPQIAEQIEQFIDEGSLPVFLSIGGGMTLAHPGEEMADAITNPKTTQSPHLIEEGREWRSQYQNLIEPLQVQHARFSSQFVIR